MKFNESDTRKKEYIDRYLNGPLRTILYTENIYKSAFNENIRDNLSLEQLKKVDERIKIYWIRMFLNELSLVTGNKNKIISIYNKYKIMFYNRFGSNILDDLTDSDRKEIKEYLIMLESIKDKNVILKKDKTNPNTIISKRYNELTGKDLSVIMFDKTMNILDGIYKNPEIIFCLGDK